MVDEIYPNKQIIISPTLYRHTRDINVQKLGIGLNIYSNQPSTSSVKIGNINTPPSVLNIAKACILFVGILFTINPNKRVKT